LQAEQVPEASHRRGGPVEPSRGTLRPLGPDEIQIVDGFWHERQQLNAEVILAHCEKWMERIGWTNNFDRAAAGTIGESHAGIEFVDSEIYKLLEAMAWELGRKPNAALEKRYTDLVDRVAAAQEPDGYLDTAFGRPAPGDRPQAGRSPLHRVRTRRSSGRVRASRDRTSVGGVLAGDRRRSLP
jgi:DUF1680 family protein